MEVGIMNNQSLNTKTCIVCDQEKSEGIMLYIAFVCSECEKEIVQTEPEEEKYKYYIDKLKVLNQLTHS
ncbi:hypothetical protein HNQ94_003717 [Salirhabdus euzebyi]|uniref:Sigma factor G inhibitor Gin n=1 Tax=Salirhabdus euzebyi TaxID=394506 RepID=A0A841Q9Y0_9BACI|nr:sigma factor G inhibitor Gin [Salirhabdus euzebyi]MBB6455220.1 hypothetical protein [Salirhabdus euzebyi]